MKERALTFGPDGTLVGVWTGPTDPPAPLAVVMVNAGVVHHVGVFRLHVRLARELAQMGLAAFRFDLSGVGDSRGRTTSATLEELVQQDIDAALDVVRSNGVERVILLGLCSGARDVLDAVGRVDGVHGIICLDLIADLRTWRFHAVHYGRRLLRPQTWNSALKRPLDIGRRILSHFHSRADSSVLMRAMPGLRPVAPREWLTDELGRFLERDGRALMVFSGGLDGNYNHESQFRGALPQVARHPNLSICYYGDADHVFSDPVHQLALIEGLTRWVRDCESEDSTRHQE